MWKRNFFVKLFFPNISEFERIRMNHKRCITKESGNQKVETMKPYCKDFHRRLKKIIKANMDKADEEERDRQLNRALTVLKCLGTKG
jgi:hypothetical protein